MPDVIKAVLSKKNEIQDKPTWLTKAVRFISVTPIEFPGSFDTSPEEIWEQCAVVQAFVEGCEASLELVEEIAKELYALALIVVQQYYVVVCLPFEQWARSEIKRQSCGPLDQLYVALQHLKRTLEREWHPAALSIDQAPAVAEKWLAMTIFHVVFAALGSKFNVATVGDDSEDAFRSHVRSSLAGRVWQRKVELLMPAAIIMDFTNRAVGTSVPRWRIKPSPYTKASAFETWENQVRGAGMAKVARDTLENVREALLPFSICHKPSRTLSWEEARVKGAAALHGELASTFAAICGGQQWLCVRGHSSKSGTSLGKFDQCAACRMKYADLCVVAPNDGDTTELRLGGNWGKRQFWQPAQCAEDDMFAQLLLAARACTLSDVVVIDAPLGEEYGGVMKMVLAP